MYIDVRVAILDSRHHIGDAGPTTSVVGVWLGDGSMPGSGPQLQGHADGAILPGGGAVDMCGRWGSNIGADDVAH